MKALILALLLILSASTPRSATQPAPIPEGTGFENGGRRLATPSVTESRIPAPSAGLSPSPSSTRTRPASDGDAPDRMILRGTASWFRSPVDTSAAGPALREAIGRGWRGTSVRVTGPAGTTTVRLGDWMRRDLLIDLDDGAFRRVCGPLSLGLCRVRVTVLGGIGLPETDR